MNYRVKPEGSPYTSNWLSQGSDVIFSGCQNSTVIIARGAKTTRNKRDKGKDQATEYERDPNKNYFNFLKHCIGFNW